MRSLIEKHIRVALGVVVALGGIIGLIGFLVPDLREWCVHHGGLGWLAFLVAVVVLCVLYISDLRVIGQKDVELGGLRQALVEATAALAAHDEQSASRLDREQFKELLGLWAWEGPMLRWLEFSFNGKHWTSKQSTPFHDFVMQWRERYFDDPTLQGAYKEFYDACARMSEWMGGEGFMGDIEVAEGVFPISIPPAHDRAGGWEEFNQVRREGEDLARTVIETRRHVEAVGRRLIR